MATSYFLLAIVALVIYYLVTRVIGLRKHIAMAEESGLPYIIVPFYVFSMPWLTIGKPVSNLLRRLPTPLIPRWLKHLSLDQSWDMLSSQYSHTELKTYLIVCPTAITGWTANAEAINQITTRRNDYPKPTHIYRSLDIYGKNLVSSEGHVWRRHRKASSPPFTERNNHLVWSESIHQAESMIKSWTGMGGDESRTIKTVASDCMLLSLHVISKAGFGIRLLWPGIESDSGDASQGPGPGHKLSYTDALEGLLHNILIVVGVPHKLLRYLPFKTTKKAYQCFTEWGKYMTEMMEAKKVQISSGETEGGMDLMGALVKSAGYGSDSKAEKSKTDYLTDQEILANAFVFILAGHETTANTIHFALILLAMEPEEQRRLQKDVESIFKGIDSSEWDYDTYLPRLFGGMVGAVMNETLRLIPPAVNIPKYTLDWQPLTIDGKQYKIPPKVMLNLTASAVHRDSRYWPSGPVGPRDEAWHPTSNHEDDLNEFRPSRWILTDNQTKKSAEKPNGNSINKEVEDLGVNTAEDTAETLFKPMKGSYIPFSDGFRSCIGRRFAQVEVLVVLARIMSEYSVEFAVDKYASDEELALMSEAQKKEIWKKARHEARETLRTRMGSIITIQLRSGSYIPLRFVRKGKENFTFSR